jgi:CRISPR-associated helicase Cas3/CRISPR-associated endonuclease Cas3-HD
MAKLTNPPYYAHSASKVSGEPELLSAHLKDVAVRAASYAEAFGAADEARITGLLHDLGKYGDLFQRRLEGKERGVDHWSAGAWEALTRYRTRGIASALAIQGHHVGLRQAAKDSLRMLDPNKLVQAHPLGLRLSEPGEAPLLQRLAADGVVLPDSGFASVYGEAAGPAAGMLDVRMLFSALVDADFIETEAHFARDRQGVKQYRQAGPALDPGSVLEAVLRYIERVSSCSYASADVRAMRAALLQACLRAGESEQGLFTLTAPTGSGKTLSMLAFALRHAKQHGLRRVVTVIPYLTIIDQTVREYAKLLEPLVGVGRAGEYVLEHHSLAGVQERGGQDGTDSEDEASRRRRELAENWDAPIVVTTSVQFLESLFSNRPSACRKLHRLARSVILFDEVQTLPTNLAIPTLATLSHLAERYHGTVVFATATQPAFTHLDEHVKKFCVNGWRPTEVARTNTSASDPPKRATVVWPDLTRPISWTELGDDVISVPDRQVLCIVNLKRHALAVFEELQGRGVEGLFHLSTNMCPAHRRATLDDVRGRLSGREPCCLVSTQCVEAGVDVDFPEVFRAFAPLDAIIQAAGRCNRNHRRSTGAVHVFLPEEEKYPDAAYEQGAGVTRLLLKGRGAEAMDIEGSELATTYYYDLYSLRRPQDRKKDLTEAIHRQDFVDVASLYRLIPGDTINVLVPYDLEAYNELAEEVRRARLNRRWILKARAHTVSLFRPRLDAPIRGYLAAVPLLKGEMADDWFIYLKPEHYSRQVGLMPPESMECLIA